MGWPHITAAREASGDPTARQVLMVLATHANADGHAWPRVATISAETGLHRTTVMRALLRLEERRQLTVVRRPGRSNVFVLTGRTVRPVAESDGGGRTVRQGVSLSATQKGNEGDLNQPPLPLEYFDDSGSPDARRAYAAEYLAEARGALGKEGA